MRYLADFYQLSVALTGYNLAHLKGTGVGEKYYDVLSTFVSEEILANLFDCFQSLQPNKEQLRSAILANACFGPVARNIIKMWYVGNWYQLPPLWQQRYAIPSQIPDEYQKKLVNGQFVISSDAYLQGLAWTALNSHPMGGRQPGFSSWAMPPENQTDNVNQSIDIVDINVDINL